MTLYSRIVQTYCSWAQDIKRNQCLVGRLQAQKDVLL